MKTKTRTKTASRKLSGAKASKPKKAGKENLEDLFEDTLKDIYWAEKLLSKALVKMAKSAQHEDLKKAFEDHHKETMLQIGRIEKCFELLEMKPVGKKCEAMDGLVKEGAEVMEEYSEGPTRDAGLIIAAQKIEHYEISSYGTLRTLANILGRTQCATLMEETKDEEASADEKLTAIAVTINQLAWPTPR